MVWWCTYFCNLTLKQEIETVLAAASLILFVLLGVFVVLGCGRRRRRWCFCFNSCDPLVLRIRTHNCNSPRRSLSMYGMTGMTTLLHVSEMRPGLGASRCIFLLKFSWEKLVILLNFLKSWSHHKVNWLDWLACLENTPTILEGLSKWCKDTHQISGLAIDKERGHVGNLLTLPRFRF